MKNISTNNWILIGAVAVAVLFGGWWLMNRDTTTQSENENENGEEVVDTTSTPIDLSSVPSTTSDNESVSVMNQPAGETVTVSSVKFTESGWVAIRDDRGWTLGASRFEAGTHSNVTVHLLRGTTAAPSRFL